MPHGAQDFIRPGTAPIRQHEWLGLRQTPRSTPSPPPPAGGCAALRIWTWMRFSPRWNCCATRSSRACPWGLAGGGGKAEEERLQRPDGSGLRAPRFIPVAEFARLRDYVGRGVITTATYAARQFGVG